MHHDKTHSFVRESNAAIESDVMRLRLIQGPLGKPHRTWIMEADLNLEKGWHEVIVGAMVESGMEDHARPWPEPWPDPFVFVYRAETPVSLGSAFGVYNLKTWTPGNLQLIRHDPSEQEEVQSIEWLPGMGPHPGSLY